MAGVAAALVLVYVFFISKDKTETALISPAPIPVSTQIGVSAGTGNQNPKLSQDFLSLLLNVKGIKLNDSILTDSAFGALHDSSILLTPDGTEGRPNPFAPVGSDIIIIPTIKLPAEN